MTGVAETAPSDTVDETIRPNHYQSSGFVSDPVQQRLKRHAGTLWIYA